MQGHSLLSARLALCRWGVTEAATHALLPRGHCARKPCLRAEFNHLRTHARFFTADNAADEAVAASTLKAPERQPHLDFEVADSSHSIMMAIKTGCKGDPIVTKNAGPVPHKQKASSKHCELAQEFLTLAIGIQGGAAGQPLHIVVPLWVVTTEVFFSC